MAGYAAAMALVFSSWREIALTENHIKQLHRDLLVYSDKDARHRGHYKTSTNGVVAFDADGNQSGVVFEPATPVDTPRLMTELVTWFNDQRSTGRLHPLLLIGIRVVMFLKIHPFQDGNGRLSRVLATFAAASGICLCGLQLARKRDRAQQGGLLPRLAADPGHDPHRRTELATLARVLRAGAGRTGEAPQPQDRSRKTGASDVAGAIPSDRVGAREHGRVTMGDVIRLTGGSRNTLNSISGRWWSRDI